MLKIYLILLFAGKYTPQYKWLANELPKVNRTQKHHGLLFLFIVQYIIATYITLYGRGNHESDVVFAGHVHAYERSVSVYSLGN